MSPPPENLHRRTIGMFDLACGIHQGSGLHRPVERFRQRRGFQSSPRQLFFGAYSSPDVRHDHARSLPDQRLLRRAWLGEEQTQQQPVTLILRSPDQAECRVVITMRMHQFGEEWNAAPVPDRPSVAIAEHAVFGKRKELWRSGIAIGWIGHEFSQIAIEQTRVDARCFHAHEPQGRGLDEAEVRALGADEVAHAREGGLPRRLPQRRLRYALQNRFQLGLENSYLQPHIRPPPRYPRR